MPFIVLLLVMGTAMARTGDTQQPIRIKADRAELDERAGTSRYHGNVHITQGSLRITAETVEVFAPDKVLTTIIATGDRATLDQTTDDGKQIHAKARKMTYDARTRIILLEGDAHLSQAGNEFASQRIEYDSSKERVVAGTPGGEGRVDIIFQPEAIQTTPEPDAAPASPEAPQ